MVEDPKNPDTEPEAEKKTRAKPKTRIQLAREKAAADEKTREKAIVAGSPLWQVIYPTGISLFRPGVDEITVEVNGQDVDVEVVDDHAHVPADAKFRADSLTELGHFQDLASQGMFRQVLAD